MQLDSASIPVHSRRQAMDWSLVLASQGIETWIENPAETGRWALAVPRQDYGRALAAIRQYRLENRGWLWRRWLPADSGLFSWGGAVWCAYLAAVFWFASQPDSGLEAAGILDKERVLSGQWWRLFTAISLHAGATHLATNLTFGFLLLGLAIARYGFGIAPLAAYLAGAMGNLASLAIYAQPFHGLGASGMVMGALGLVAAQSVASWRLDRVAGRLLVSGILGGLMLFALLGSDPSTDVVAHAGGFVAGILLGGSLALAPPTIPRSRAVNAIGFGLHAALIVWTWWLALRHLAPPDG